LDSQWPAQSSAGAAPTRPRGHVQPDATPTQSQLTLTQVYGDRLVEIGDADDRGDRPNVSDATSSASGKTWSSTAGVSSAPS
jgi:hypothetical protein